jgi:hypothetical protein
VRNWQWAGSAVVVAAVAGSFWVWTSDSDLGGHAGDEIAERIERDCTGSTRQSVDPEDFHVPAFSRQATEEVFITCPSGFVNPFAELTRFRTPAALRKAFRISGPKVDRDWYCVAGRDAIRGSFSDFVGLCGELDGTFRCPPACQERVRANRIPPVPGSSD